jgi:hypothetical protein
MLQWSILVTPVQYTTYSTSGKYVRANAIFRFMPSPYKLIIVVRVDGEDYVSDLRPPTDLLFILQMMYESEELWWNAIDRGKPKNWKKNLS